MATWLRIWHSRARTTLLGAIVLVAILAACGGGSDGGGSNASNSGDSSTLPTTVAMSLKDNAFSPNKITVAAGKEITFELKNEGSAIHNVDVKLDGKGTISNPDAIKPGQAGKLLVTFRKAGAYDFKCDFHPAEMTGKIRVK